MSEGISLNSRPLPGRREDTMRVCQEPDNRKCWIAVDKKTGSPVLETVSAKMARVWGKLDNLYGEGWIAEDNFQIVEFELVPTGKVFDE